MYGQGNSGPAREVWRPGDRVRLVAEHAVFTGTVGQPPPDQERTAFQTGFVWVRWDDIDATWADPNSLDVADVR